MIIIPWGNAKAARVCRMSGNFEMGYDITGRECPVSDHKCVKVKPGFSTITGGNIYFDEEKSNGGKISRAMLEEYGVEISELSQAVLGYVQKETSK